MIANGDYESGPNLVPERREWMIDLHVCGSKFAPG
jgi:hypothetical protein